jgi:hypothetical protein
MKGLGDLTEKVISIFTLGQGKKIATYIAKLRGKEDCGCDKRQQYLNDKFSFTKEQVKMKTAKFEWTNHWHHIRGQVACSCQFDYGYIEVRDKNNNFITEAQFDAPPMLNGQLRSIELGILEIAEPAYFNIRFHKKEGGFTADVKVEINEN